MNHRHLIYALALTLAFPLVLPGCGGNSNLTEQEHIQRAKDFEDKGDLTGSILELKNAVQKNPDSPQARLLLGQVYVKAGLGAEAEKELARAEALGVKKESIAPLLGKAWLLMGEYKRVLAEISLPANTSLQNKAVLTQLQGDANMGLGKLEEGCRLYSESVALDPKQVPANRGLAQCASLDGKYEEARAIVRKALELDEKDSDTWVLLGDVEWASGQLPTAENAYSNAIKRNRQDVKGLLRRASLRIRSSNLDGAAQDIAAARAIAPQNLLAKHSQATLHFQQGKYAEAQTSLQEILRSDPNYAPSMLLASAVSYALGSYEQAAKYASKALAMLPNNVYGRKVLAAALLQLGQASDALDVLKPMLGDTTRDGGILALAGEAALQAKEYALASKYLEQATKNNSQNADFRMALGMAHIAGGESGRAIAELEAAAELDPSQHKADTVLVLTHLKKEEWDKALAASEQLEKKQPNNPNILNLRGAAYVGKKEFAKARKSFEQALAAQPTSMAAAMNLAELDLLENNPDAARKRYKAILEKDKSNLQAMLALANLASRTNLEGEYVDWLEKAAKASPSSLRPRELLVAYYIKKKESQKALVIAREGLAANKGLEAMDLLGMAQFAAGERDNALSTYTKLATLAPKSPLTQFKLGSIQAAMSDVSAAEASLGKALQLRPDYAEAATALTRLKLGVGKPSEALKIAKQLQGSAPQAPIGFMLEGDVLLAQKKYTEAQKSYEKAFMISKNGLLAVKMHQVLSLAGNVNQADKGLLQWLNERPNDLGARGYLADVYMKAGKSKAAVEQYQLILKEDANNLPALNNLAWLYQHEKDPRALAMAEHAYKQKPDSPIVLDTLGWMLVEQGQAAKGLKLLEKATAAAPSRLDIGYHYAVALAKTGSETKARKVLEKIITSGQMFPEKAQAEALLKQL